MAKGSKRPPGKPFKGAGSKDPNAARSGGSSNGKQMQTYKGKK